MEKKSVTIAKALNEIAKTIATAMVELNTSIQAKVTLIRDTRLALREDCNELADINNAVADFVDTMEDTIDHTDHTVNALDNYLEYLEDNSDMIAEEDNVLDLVAYEEPISEEELPYEDTEEEEED